VLEGSPEFLIGPRVLVFLRVSRDGTLAVLQLYQGKLSVMTIPSPATDAIRIKRRRRAHPSPPPARAAPQPKDTHRLDDLRPPIRRSVADVTPGADGADADGAAGQLRRHAATGVARALALVRDSDVRS